VERLSLAPGTELLGRFDGGGGLESTYLLRRFDGRTLSVSKLLYEVASAIDGERDASQVALVAGAATKRRMTPDDVRYLYDQKLAPLGITQSNQHEPPAAALDTRPLALSIRRAVIPRALVGRAARWLSPLFHRAVVGILLVALVATDGWIVAERSVVDAFRATLVHPGALLTVVVLTIVAGGVHELGHAAATVYGGGEPGVIGIGIYLVWPVFYNDLNDSYRLPRRDRLRADLGGVYFNVVFSVLSLAVYAITSYQPLLVVITLQHAAVLQQFLPFVRLDGYYVVSDLTGVPDLFGRIKPVLASLLPGHRLEQEVQDLKPAARRAVAAWVLVTVPVLAVVALLVIVRLPSVVLAAAASSRSLVRVVVIAVRRGSPATAIVALVQLVLVCVPVVGLGASLIRVGVVVRRRRRRTPVMATRVTSVPAGTLAQPPTIETGSVEPAAPELAPPAPELAPDDCWLSGFGASTMSDLDPRDDWGSALGGSNGRRAT
jgi:putative peptide zinc metalloprotease protein